MNYIILMGNAGYTKYEIGLIAIRQITFDQVDWMACLILINIHILIYILTKINSITLSNMNGN